jgi:hypothetical protein
MRILYLHNGYFSNPTFVLENDPSNPMGAIDLIKFLSSHHYNSELTYKTVFNSDVTTLNALGSFRRLTTGEGNDADFISLWFNDAANDGIVELENLI